MKRILFLLLLSSLGMTAQEVLEGRILDGNAVTETPEGLFGANVYWQNTQVGAVTDMDGNFTIPYKAEYRTLLISYVGYVTDTIAVTSNKRLEHSLQMGSSLTAVQINARKKASTRSLLTPQNTILISSDELLKAACCNLSESFETNPSIDVNFADAVSGTRQVKMLGLTSPNILITTENIPAIRGAAQTYGLSFIPGTWVESIQITKGAGSVVNGFESIAGQINAELQKPSKDDRVFVNAYAGLNGRLEFNTHLNTKVDEHWDTGLYLHGNLRDQKFDNNNDTFLDLPLAEQINIMNRWQYTNLEKGIVSFINLRFMNDEKQAGQIDFDPDENKFTTNAWGSEIDTQRFEVSTKLGWVNPEIPYQSLGFQTAYSNHKQESYFGLNQYDITHNSFYSNLIYNSIISDSRHKVKTGVSFTFDSYDEVLTDLSFARKENSVGGFFEYAYDNLDALTLTAGVRVDNHNLLGFFVTPRIHVRYAPWEQWAIRLSAGRGRRSANIFTENQQLFATSRNIEILNSEGKIYGLDPEDAWNYGVSIMRRFKVLGRNADITLDYYRTDYLNQVVVDWENSQRVSFYNLEGSSYANSFQAELNFSPINRLDIRTAFKYYDVQTDYISGRLERPLTPKTRIFANAGYETPTKDNGAHWKADATFNWLGTQRYPSTRNSGVEFRLPERTPSLGTLTAQITRVFSPSFEVYLGGENIANYRQETPILSAENPFGSNFDSTFVYGPIFGSMYYIGLRYKIKKS